MTEPNPERIAIDEKLGKLFQIVDENTNGTENSRNLFSKINTLSFHLTQFLPEEKIGKFGGAVNELIQQGSEFQILHQKAEGQQKADPYTLEDIQLLRRYVEKIRDIFFEILNETN